MRLYSERGTEVEGWRRVSRWKWSGEEIYGSSRFTYSGSMHDARVINNDIQPAKDLETCSDSLLPVFAFRRIACEVHGHF
jgi:hypothetical protein